jgi:hypothetical protein
MALYFSSAAIRRLRSAERGPSKAQDKARHSGGSVWANTRSLQLQEINDAKIHVKHPAVPA